MSQSADADQRLPRPDLLARQGTLTPGARYKMKLCTGEYPVEVEKIEKVIDVNDLATSEPNTSSATPSPRWCYARGERWRSIRSTTTCSPAGSSSSRTTTSWRRPHQYGRLRRPAQQAIKSTNIFLVEHRVPIEERWKTNGHRGGILWMTGLSGAGKSTSRSRSSSIYSEKGYLVYVLDGDNVRHGLCSDLGFSPRDQSRTSAGSVRPPSCSPAPAFWC